MTPRSVEWLGEAAALSGRQDPVLGADALARDDHTRARIPWWRHDVYGGAPSSPFLLSLCPSLPLRLSLRLCVRFHRGLTQSATPQGTNDAKLVAYPISKEAHSDGGKSVVNWIAETYQKDYDPETFGYSTPASKADFQHLYDGWSGCVLLWFTF
jgi:hypothetical protein